MNNDKFCMMITEILSSESYDFSAVREILVQYKEAGMKQGGYGTESIRIT